MAGALLAAIEAHDARAVAAALAAGADPDARDAHGRPALVVAISRPGYPERIVLALVGAGADVTAAGSVAGLAMPVVAFALAQGYGATTIATMVARGADPTAPAGLFRDRSTLEVAAASAPEVAEAILCVRPDLADALARPGPRRRR